VCIDVNHAGGLGHTAVIFSRNDEVIRKFSEVMDAGRIIVNSPGSIGALGGVYNDMVPTFSFGCGTGGGNSTTDNVNLYHYLNLKRVARRTQAHMWFRVPNQIYFNMNAVENLRHFPSRSTLIVTNPMLEQMGHVDVVRRSIPPQTSVRVLAIPDAEPEVKVVMHGVEALNLHQADQIIALGGGSVIDAAKIMKLKYESPEADLEELAAPFLDIRKRVIQYPARKADAVRLIAISTTSGTGSEVTPFAVLIDKERGRKVTLADYSLSPDVAIVDPQFVMSMPKGLTADTGIDCLTHGLEAGVSIHASPYTDSNAMQAIRLVFKYLPIAYEKPRDEEARSMMHNAACIAALAFSNASVGVNHALAHAFGARFGIGHGRANALMLPHVIAYNASVPTKFMPSPNQRAYVAHKKYAMVADLLGLGGDTIAEKVNHLVIATEEPGPPALPSGRQRRNGRTYDNRCDVDSSGPGAHASVPGRSHREADPSGRRSGAGLHLREADRYERSPGAGGVGRHGGREVGQARVARRQHGRLPRAQAAETSAALHRTDVRLPRRRLTVSLATNAGQRTAI
jgi:acetaldehyde dehydrogenase/alcohol dehydrogenase